jgi:molybdate-binding protein
MREAAAQEGGMTATELAAWVRRLRTEQGLPPKVENPTSLQRIADLMRSADERVHRRRAS